MITKLPRKHGNPRVLLDYLGGTDDPERRFLASNMSAETPAALAAELETFSHSLRPALHDFTKHMVLSFPPGEVLPEEQYRAIVCQYLDGMGYGDSPHAAYLHTDTPHHHLHIVTTPTTYRGEHVNESWDWPRSECVAREIEKTWNLREVELSETAKKRSPTQDEYHSMARRREASLRGFVREGVSTAARQARTFRELAEALAKRGYTVSIQVNQERDLRGISFAYGDVAFTGSQLGRAFRGSNFLTAYGIDKPTAEDVERYRAPLPGREANREIEPAPPALSLPPGTYLVQSIPGSEARENAHHAGAGHSWDRGLRLTHEELVSRAPELRELNRRHMLLVQQLSEPNRRIFFRGVTDHQLAKLRREGLEPSMVVRVGRRFDVELRVSEKLTTEERDRVRAWITARYSLAGERDALRSFVRLPGYEAVPGKPESRAELIALRDAPMPASQRILAEVRRENEYKEIEFHARDAVRHLPSTGVSPAYDPEAQEVLLDLARARRALVIEPSAEALERYRRAVLGDAERELGMSLEEYRTTHSGRDAAQHFQARLSAVAEGDLHPRALRQLNAGLLLELPDGAIPARLPIPALSHAEAEQRLKALMPEIQQLARSAANAQDGHTLAPLFARSLDALELLERRDAATRRLRGLVDPGPAPRGVSQAAWDAGWLQRAVQKGMDPYEAAAHLGNASGLRFTDHSRALDHAIRLTALALQHGLYALYGYARRVLSL